MVKVLHLVSGSLSGGAARGTMCLHRGLLSLGIDSYLLTNSRDNVTSESVGSLAETTFQKLKCILLPRLGALPNHFYPNRKRWTFSTGFTGIDFINHPAYREADIIHLHWINGLVSMRILRKINKPIVWTLRDMWPFTGGCHYSMGCTRYEVGCGQCPQLASSRNLDLSRIIYANKSSALPRRINLVAISRWLAECASESNLFSGLDIKYIPNNVDTKEFTPVNQDFSRQVLGLPEDKKIILIGAQSPDDFYKGFDLCIRALNSLDTTNYHVVFFGNISPSSLSSLSHDFTLLGFLSDTVSLRLAYSAADLFLAPSRMDAFGKTLVESMACSTPVVCFDATGPADIVQHQITGYKAQPFEYLDLASGIEWVLSRDFAQNQSIRSLSRIRAVELFDSRVVSTQYSTLYKQILSSS